MDPTHNPKLAVMFVDDEPKILQAIRRVIRREPYGAVFASSGAEALAKMRETPVQVVVSDLNMPEMDGLALLHAVRRQYQFRQRHIDAGCDGRTDHR